MSKLVTASYRLFRLVLLLVLSTQAVAQTVPMTSANPAANSQAATYHLDKMPQLADDSGTAGIIAAIQQRVVYPPAALRDNKQGQVLVKFIVAADGQVKRIKIVKGLRRDLNEAVIEAVRQLPRFEPGTRDGRPVVVAFTAPITFAIDNPLLSRP